MGYFFMIANIMKHQIDASKIMHVLFSREFFSHLLRRGESLHFNFKRVSYYLTLERNAMVLTFYKKLYMKTFLEWQSVITIDWVYIYTYIHLYINIYIYISLVSFITINLSLIIIKLSFITINMEFGSTKAVTSFCIKLTFH